MNERIKELARQSGLIQYDTDSKTQDAERFAELLIKECATICVQELADPRDSVELKCAKRILSHFGVE